MNINEITSQKLFNKTFKRNYLSFSSKRFLLILLFLILGIFPIFISKISNSVELKFDKDKFFKNIKLLYLSVDLPEQEKKVYAQTIKNDLITSVDKKENVELKENEIETKSIEGIENGILLDDDSGLDDILNSVISVNNRVRESRGSVFVENFNKSIDTERAGKIELNRGPKERKIIERTWLKEELETMERTVIANEKTIYQCYNKYRDEIFVKRGFVYIQFEITPEGKLEKKSIKLLDTDIKNKEFLSCIKKRVKYFRGFKKAKNPNAKNYVFHKKWYF